MVLLITNVFGVRGLFCCSYQGRFFRHWAFESLEFDGGNEVLFI